MPVYEYKCEPCHMIYQVRQGMNDAPLQTCPTCEAQVARLISAPNFNQSNYSSPTQAKYAKMSDAEEIAREQVWQKSYQTVWLPAPVKHNP
ncbi:MAG: zinc ribbon domain-containing protein [Candidatus Tectomicrobia bacterium]|nr:zinc ribbon domain-containing protein [Candidatus Tectomicrobia bacterium]